MPGKMHLASMRRPVKTRQPVKTKNNSDYHLDTHNSQGGSCTFILCYIFCFNQGVQWQ